MDYQQCLSENHRPPHCPIPSGGGGVAQMYAPLPNRCVRLETFGEEVWGTVKAAYGVGWGGLYSHNPFII